MKEPIAVAIYWPEGDGSLEVRKFYSEKEIEDFKAREDICHMKIVRGTQLSVEHL